MRLLYFDDNGDVSLTKDLLGNDTIPPYAILSHTWAEEEVTFDDITTEAGKQKLGFDKIRFCMQQAAEDDLQYSWVDTCCINKNDTTELQHAINSMFRWYRDAETCYVFLSDVSATKRKVDSDFYLSNWESAFRSSRWFTRGWTLQELLAPRRMRFFSREKKLLGDNQDLLGLVQDITSLPTAALSGDPLDGFEIEERLRWTQTRITTREEDKAYSLLGIFGIFMPLIYGEGEENAFRRLRREIHDRKYLSLGTSVTRQSQSDVANTFHRISHFFQRGLRCVSRICNCTDPHQSQSVSDPSLSTNRKAGIMTYTSQSIPASGYQRILITTLGRRVLEAFSGSREIPVPENPY